jgi:hypothetical protein
MNENVDISIFQPDGPLLVINDEQGNPMVTIERDRTLTYGENYDPDKAARIFWDSFARHAHEPVVLS